MQQSNNVIALQQTALEELPEEEDLSECRTRKTVSVSIQTYYELQKFKTELRGQFGEHISFNRIIHYLLRVNRQYSNILSQLETSEQKNSELINEEREFLRQVVLSQNQNRIPVMMGAMSNVNLHSSAFAPPPPPPVPAPIKRKYLKPYKPIDTGNLKKDYIHEIKQIFTGEILKPSEIIEATKPKHQLSEIIPISDEFEVPTIESISWAKNVQNTQEMEVTI